MKKNFNYHEHDELPENLMINTMSNVASAGESTGMMPTPPANKHEFNSYHDMAAMAIPKYAPAKNPKKEKRRAVPEIGRHYRPSAEI